MTACRHLPPVARCPNPDCSGKPVVQDAGAESDVQVVCPCGWAGPPRRTERGAVNAWNRGARDGGVFETALEAIACLDILMFGIPVRVAREALAKAGGVSRKGGT